MEKKRLVGGRWQEKTLPRTNPTDAEPRARPPTRAPSLHVIGHLHLCIVTGSIADLWRKEAEASRPSQSCFVRGFLAVPRPLLRASAGLPLSSSD
ncbi:unnamed protein product [Rangifer tarandus platyrhynchus]|uniref:Uncharacterized protein n=1 Tax=Rangifer tarandus platyrhynchus TaxID=3082113 RepID=A0AC59ZG52_RANTA